MQTTAFIVGTGTILIEQTPPNYSIIIDRLYIGNFADTLASLQIYANAYTYNPSNPPATSTVVSTIMTQIANFPVVDSVVVIDEDDALRLPTSSFIYAAASSGSIALTYNSRYVYTRE